MESAGHWPCSRCRHWQPPARYSRSIYGTCAQAESTRGQPREPTTAAYAADLTGYRAVLRVLPTFSCLMWEPDEMDTSQEVVDVVA